MKVHALAVCLFLATVAAAQRGVSPAGSISGTLSWRDGTPAAGVRVSAVEAQARTRGGAVSMMAIAQTDSEGRFHLDAVPPGRYFISAGPLDAQTVFPGVLAEADGKAVEVGAGASLQGIDFRLATVRLSGRIRGLVLGESLTQILMVGSNRITLTAPVRTDGSFEFTNLLPDIYQFRGPASFGSPALSLTMTIGDRDILDHLIALPIVTVTGTVTVDEETPQPRFQLIFSDTGQTGQTSLVTGQIAAVMNAQVPTGIHRVTVIGLPSGYVVKSITAGDLDLRSDLLPVSVDGVPPIQIVLGTGGTPHWPTIRGRIAGRGSLDTAPLTVQVPLAGSFSGMQKSDPPIAPVFFLDGSFEVPRLAPGRYILYAQSPGLQVDVTNDDLNDIVVHVPFSEGTAVSAADYGPRVRGRIVGRARTVPHAIVRLAGVGAETRPATIYADGSFEFAHVPPGVYKAEVIPRIPGAVPTTLRVGATDLSGVEIPVPATQEIAGRVVVDNGGPIPRVLRFMVAGVGIPAPLQPDGRFILIATEGEKLAVWPQSLPDGFSVRSMTYGALDLLNGPLHFSAAGTNKLILTLQLPAPSAVHGRVNAKEAALNAGHVWLTDKAGLLRTLEARVTREGAFEFSNVPPGIYTLRFAAPGVSAGGETTITVAAGKDVAGIELVWPTNP